MTLPEITKAPLFAPTRIAYFNPVFNISNAMKAMAGEKSFSTPLQMSIGNCKLTVEGSAFSCTGTGGSLVISTANAAKIKISDSDSLLSNLSFVLVNPKDADSQSKDLLQEALSIYVKELPTMSYAANTGKESNFLERCVSSGKYCTLLLRSSVGGVFTETIAALTFQIIPADTQYAEVPLAAVSSIYQNKGFGRLLYSELKKRLQSVGICTILCWGDKESEEFWVKQGFVVIAEVDAKGKVRRLPLKTDIRRALCFPGGSTLMVSHLNTTNISPLKLSNYLESHLVPTDQSKLSTSISRQKLRSTVAKRKYSENGSMLNETIPQIHTRSQFSIKDGCSTDDNEDDMNIWETTLSSLKSKKVKGSKRINYSSGDNSSKQDSFSKDNIYKQPPCPELGPAVQTEESGPVCVVANEDDLQEKCLPKGDGYRIMLMDIADDAKKAFLTKIIENLGGAIAPDGSFSTHVITGKARKTRNFCVALCSGAWVVSANWLKESTREGRFVDESSFILQDEEYKLKYRSEIKEAVIRAKSHPGGLLKGYDICLAKHVQPPHDILSDIVKSAGGNVVRSLNKVGDPSRTIFIACEEDLEEAMLAAKKGMWTFNSDWFMSCVMRQELDLKAPEFAESL